MSETRNIRTYITDIESNANYESAITVEHRSNNPKRDYLFVNKLQCKHLPASPLKMKNMCRDLASKCTNIKPDDKVLVIGFAETATAIGKFVAEYTDNCYWFMSTTREDIEESVELITFEEEHSHATTQKLLTYNSNFMESVILPNITYVLFVEDEISTGNTIMNFIKAFKAKYDYNFRFGVASICNWQNDENIEIFTKNKIDRYYLISGKLRDVNAKMNISGEYHLHSCSDTILKSNNNIDSIFRYQSSVIFRNSRLGCDNPRYYYDTLNDIKDDIVYRQLKSCTSNNIRVIGSEECMSFAIDLGAKLERLGNNVLSHSTTRSCIDVIKGDISGSKVITSRNRVYSAYEEDRKSYIYNCNINGRKDDLIVIISDSTNNEQFTKFIYSVAALFENNSNRIIAYNI